MKKKFPVLTSVLVIIACTLPAALGFDAVSAVLISAYLTSALAGKSTPLYILYSVLSAAAFFVAVFFNAELFLVYFPPAFAVSLALGICIKTKCSLARTITTASLIAITALAVIIYFGMKKYAVSATALIFGNYINTLKVAVSSIPELSMISAMLPELEKALDLLLPSMIILAAGFFSYFSFGIARAFLGKNNITVDMRRFYELRLMPSFTFIFVIADIISLAMGGNAFFSNINIVLSTLFVMCGISVIDFYLDLKGMPMPLRILIYVFAFIFTTFMGAISSIIVSILQLVGLIDSVRPLRRIPTDRF